VNNGENLFEMCLYTFFNFHLAHISSILELTSSPSMDTAVWIQCTRIHVTFWWQLSLCFNIGNAP